MMLLRGNARPLRRRGRRRALVLLALLAAAAAGGGVLLLSVFLSARSSVSVVVRRRRGGLTPTATPLASASAPAGTGAFAGVPPLELVAVSHPADFPLLFSVLIASYRLFWPASWNARSSVWGPGHTSGSYDAPLTIVLDADAETPEGTAAVRRLLAREGPGVAAAPPALPRSQQTPPALPNRHHRGAGYDAQQYAYFLADRRARTDAPFLGLVDSDTLFATAPLPRLLFDTAGRPVVVGFGARDPISGTKFAASTSRALCGRAAVADFMAYFPVVVRREHLAETRAHVTRCMNASSFEAAFGALAEMWPYSQFSVILNFLWHNHREDYVWHLDGADPAALRGGALGAPVIRAANHASKLKGSFAAVAAELDEGLCRVLGARAHPRCCALSAAASSGIHRALFKWDLSRPLWANASLEELLALQNAHYAEVHRLLGRRGEERGRGCPPPPSL